MDAKRIVPMLQVLAGDPGQEPARTACQLELEGADGILFQAGSATETDWIRAVAGSLSVPFALEAPFRSWAELEQALEAGADRVILAGPAAMLTAAAQAFGRSRVAVAVDAILGPSGWRVELAGEPEGRAALDWMLDLEQRGCGEILLSTSPEGEAGEALFQGAARLALAILYRSTGDEARTADALLHGADGAAIPAARTPSQWKAALAIRGLAVRNLD